MYRVWGRVGICASGEPICHRTGLLVSCSFCSREVEDWGRMPWWVLSQGCPRKASAPVFKCNTSQGDHDTGAASGPMECLSPATARIHILHLSLGKKNKYIYISIPLILIRERNSMSLLVLFVFVWALSAGWGKEMKITWFPSSAMINQHFPFSKILYSQAVKVAFGIFVEGKLFVLHSSLIAESAFPPWSF